MEDHLSPAERARALLAAAEKRLGRRRDVRRPEVYRHPDLGHWVAREPNGNGFHGGILGYSASHGGALAHVAAFYRQHPGYTVENGWTPSRGWSRAR